MKIHIPNLTNTDLNIVITVAAGLLAFFGFSSELAERTVLNFKIFKWLQILSLRFLIVALLTVATLWATNKKDDLSEDKNHLRDSSNTVQAVRLNNRSIDTIIKATNEGLKFIGLKYDSVSKKLTTVLKDTTHNVIIQPKDSTPEFRVQRMALQKYSSDTAIFDMYYMFSGANAFKFICKHYKIFHFSEGQDMSKIDKDKTLIGIVNVQKNFPIVKPLNFQGLRKNDLKEVFVLLIGTFEDSKKHVYTVQKTLEFNLDTKMSSTIFDNANSDLVKEFNNFYKLDITYLSK